MNTIINEIKNVQFSKGVATALLLMLTMFLSSCQDNDIDRADMILAPVEAENISGQLQGDDYVLTWPALKEGQTMQVAVYRNGTFYAAEIVNGTSYTQKSVPTGVAYEFVFKVSDGTNLSSGVIKSYTRPGAASVTGLSLSQIEKASGYDAKVIWNAPANATSILFTATNGNGRIITETLPVSQTEYTITDVRYNEDWTVTIVAKNAEGASLPTTASLHIGKTAIGFLSIYNSPSELVSNGDDDEASAWLWFHEQYPNGSFVPFSSIASAADIEEYRVLFWLRDLEGVTENDVWNMPASVQAATPFIREWYKAGGSMLLWSHATPFIGDLGRIDKTMLQGNDHTFSFGLGSSNGDTWKMAVSANPGGKFSADFSTHPIYRGLNIENGANGTKLLAVKGPGWTEDHNCLYFNLPATLTGFGNQDENCYNALTQTYGIYPLGTWDSQTAYISQLNVWEAQQGNSDFKGTIICIGNGGCEFSLRNADGTADVSAHPKNNQYQDNIEKMAHNALEYLKTR
ncbi:DUF4960 domain-containing protein [Prevotella sp. HUN102]|uniref:DUF4960 domain-containing protein n=1 Tax=Prevotella sp. HUN102 TaxID=1392486 RepID=UPI00068D1F5A|nr:DUF4960 domain-containing protein [Prevotella sp. HUN102]